MNKCTAFLGLSWALVLFCGCGRDVKLTGVGGQTTNGITGLVADGRGPVAGITVSLLSDNYVPLSEGNPWQVRLDTITDLHGRFQFRDLGKGRYNIVAAQSASGLGALVRGLEVLTDTSTLTVANVLVRANGQMSISLNELNADEGAILFVPGTPFTTVITKENVAAGALVFKGLPAGDYDQIGFLGTRSNQSFNILESKLAVVAGQTAMSGPYAAWTHAAEISINTSATGANIHSDLLGFPLMLHLTNENFDFESAGTGGRDLRIAKSDDTPLPYEIESWDSAGHSAIVWVAMDTVKANTSNQSLRMYWGNIRAQNKSNGPAVFDAKNGFSGVWHLSDNGPGFSITESSGQFPGIARNLLAEMNSADISSDAVIGKGVALTAQKWIDLGQERNYLNGQSAATLSGWFNPVLNAKVDGLLNIGIGHAVKDPAATRAGVEITAENVLSVWARAADGEPVSQKLASVDTLKNGNWYFFTAIVNYQADSLYLYMDGELRAAGLVAFVPQAASTANSSNSSIGSEDNGNSSWYTGKLDEMRVMKGVSSAAWIKMNYENQKIGSTVVTIVKLK